MTAESGNVPLAEGKTARRALLRGTLFLAMLGGLVASYGTFASLAVRFLLPKRRGPQWLYVARIDRIRPGESFLFISPLGVPVLVRREQDSSQAGTPVFAALSSTCPHLGCQVHWEAQHNRFFCPCHNGTFDPTGEPTGGPVLAADQRLPRYPLKIEHGLVFIQMAASTLGDSSAEELTPHRRSRRSAQDISRTG